MENQHKPRILIGVCGSLDATLLPSYFRTIRDNIDCTLTALLTPNATNFVRPESVALYVDRVISGDHPKDWPTDKPGRIIMDHDLLAILPTTANTLASIAHGMTGNRLTTVVLGATFPVLLFPVMGASMWQKPATRRNLEWVKEDGYEVIEPVWREHFDPLMGRVHGHHSLPDPEVVLEAIRRRLGQSRTDGISVVGKAA